MKLTKLHIENFRSLRNVTWEPGDLNVLIGPNAGGKSNLLKAIDFLAAAANGELREHVIQSGGIGATAWNGTTDTINLCVSSHATEHGNSRQFFYGIELAAIGRKGDYSILGEALDSNTDGAQPKILTILSRDKRETTVDGLTIAPDVLKDGESALSYATHPRTNGAGGPFGRYVSEWKSYQGFRTDEESPARGSEVSRREPVLRGNGGNLVSVLHTLYSDNSSFESDINDAMNAAFGDEYVKLVFSPDAADQRIQLKVRWKSLDNPVPSWDLSDGTLRFLYLLAILANPNPPTLVAIDEPEIGLHPRMITIIAELAADAADRTQLVFTTQSPEFLDAMTPFNPVTTVVESQNSESTVHNISKERLDHWLKGYTLGELFRTNGLETMP